MLKYSDQFLGSVKLKSSQLVLCEKSWNFNNVELKRLTVYVFVPQLRRKWGFTVIPLCICVCLSMCLSVRKNIFLGTIYNRCFKCCHTVCLGMPYSRDLFLYQLHFNFLLIDDFVYFESKLVRKLASCFLSFHPCCQWMIHEFKYGMSQIISL